MSAQDKTIKISFAVDPSLQTAKRAIESITDAVRTLVKESQQLGNIFGGGGGGRASAIPPRPGTAASTQIQHQAAGGNANNAIKGLTTGAAGAAGVFKSAAAASKLAFTSMAQGFEAMVTKHEQDVLRLEKVMTRYLAAVGKGGGAFGGGGRSGGIAGAVAAANGGAGAVQAARVGGGGTTAVGGGAAAAGGGGAAAGGGGGMVFGPNGALSSIANRFGIPMGALGGAAAVTAGVNVANFVTGSAYENQLSNLNMMIDRPTFMAQGRASLGRIMGGNAQSIRHGDMYRGYAQSLLAKDAETQSMLGQDYFLEGRRQMENPTTIGGHMAKSGGITGSLGIGKAKAGSSLNDNTPSDYENAARSQAAEFRAKAAAATGSKKVMYNNLARSAEKGLSKTGPSGSFAGTLIEGVETERVDVIALKRAKSEQIALQAQRQQEQLERKILEDPRTQEQMNSQYASALGDASMFRSLGMSGNQIHIKGDPRKYEAGGYMRSQAFKNARDIGEYSGAAQELGATAGRGFLGFGNAGKILGLKTGGLHNAAQIFGVGAQFGGGTAAGANAFIGRGARGKFGGSGIQGMIGRGGVDVTAGSHLINAGMATMMAPNFVGGSGSGLMETILQAAYTGTPGGDMRKARELASGMQLRETRSQGGIDQLNKAMNLSAAMGAAPDAPWTVRNMLASMQDGSIIDILKTGKVPDRLADNGVTLGMIQKYHSETNATKFARFGSAAEYGTEEQRAAVERYREDGGLGYMKGWSKRDRERELNRLAGAQATGEETSLMQARADLDIEASLAGVLGKKLRGRGAGDSFDRNSTAGKAAQARSIIEMDDSAEKAEKAKIFEKQFGLAPSQVLANEEARKKGQSGMVPGGDVDSAIVTVTQALTNLAEVFKNEFKGGGKGKGAPTAAGPQ